MKIGRLGVSNKMQGKGIGRHLVGFVIELAIIQNEVCACRLLTVDAYRQSLSFYENLGFSYFSEADKEKNTRQMYLDLVPLINGKINYNDGQINQEAEN
jgi:GNAT superfamily N-acetyltransferase